MLQKKRPPQIYKTESQLKEEALIKQAAEASASAASHKSGLQKKYENFWYHYKWHTIASVFATVLLLFFIKDMFFQTKPDATVIMVSQNHLGEYERSFIASRLNEYAEDFNGDKKTYIAIDLIPLPAFDKTNGQIGALAPSPADGQQEMAYAMKLMAVLSANSDPIYLLDDEAYNYITGMGQNGNPGENADIFEAFSVSAEKLDSGPSNPFKDMRFYLRASHKDEKYYEYCRQILQKLDRS